MNFCNQQKEIENIIAESWDANVELRAKELCESTDFSYHHIIVPWVLKNIEGKECLNGNVLDIGCGCGYLTNVLFSNGCKSITGIDISENSVKIAKKLYPHIEFVQGSIFSYVAPKEITLCVSVMTVNNLSNIDLFLNKIKTILSIDGRMILVLPHPCFWPIKHLGDSSFSYLEEKVYAYHFSTKMQKGYPSTVPYFHRPLERYFNCIFNNGFTIEKVSELPEEECYEKPDIMGIVIKKCRI